MKTNAGTCPIDYQEYLMLNRAIMLVYRIGDDEIAGSDLVVACLKLIECVLQLVGFIVIMYRVLAQLSV